MGGTHPALVTFMIDMDLNLLNSLAALIEKALVEPKKRARTRVNRVGKEQRIKSKKARGTVKANRGKVDW